MDQTVRDYVVEQTHRLMEAFSCSGEAKEAAQAWLAALGTDREAEETRKYVQELEEDLVTVDQLIAFAAALDRGETASLDAEHCAALGSLGNFHADFAGQGGNIYDTASDRRCERNGDFADDIQSIARENTVRTQFDNHIKIARRTALNTGFPLPGDFQLGAVANSCRNMHLKVAGCLNASLTAAIRTSRSARVRVGTCSTANRAGNLLAETDLFFFDAVERLVKRNFNLELEIVSALTARAARGTSARCTAEKIFEVDSAGSGLSENIAEKVVRVAEVSGIGIFSSGTARTAGSAVEHIGTEPVVIGTFLRVAEHFIGFGDLFELLLRRFVSGILIRMIFHGKLTVCALDFIGRRRFRQTEHFVIIFVCCHCVFTSNMRSCACYFCSGPELTTTIAGFSSRSGVL